jgi:hypothetical protein
MQRKIQLTALVAVSLITGTAGAFAQGYDRYAYDRYGNAMAWQPGGPAYAAPAPGPMYYPGPGYYPGAGSWGRGFNGANHPTPSSSQGDVGPGGNNNGTLTGYYRPW